MAIKAEENKHLFQSVYFWPATEAGSTYVRIHFYPSSSSQFLSHARFKSFYLLLLV